MLRKEESRLEKGEAERIAVEGLQFIANDMELLGKFLALSGLGPHSLRDAAADPGFLAGVLEFLMADETTLLAFLETQRIRPTMIAAAHFRLAGDAPAHD
ncbi:MAG: DUF3572 domain-containing protein [Hyphomicrobiales bacterium]|nr:MAG: DUF3572 domain-containing protein [Hyphomicrobiales bacterium]